MPLPIARTYTAAFWGEAVKIVQCEQCAKHFVYRVKRRAEGEGTSLLFLDEEGAQQRAIQRAELRLKKTLDGATDVVPCPACGWIQSDMQAQARRQHLPRLRIAGIVLLVALVIPLLMLLAATTRPSDGHSPHRLVTEILILFFVQIATAVSLLVGRSVAAANFDPNGQDVEARVRKGRDNAVLVDDLVKSEQDGPS